MNPSAAYFEAFKKHSIEVPKATEIGVLLKGEGNPCLYLSLVRRGNVGEMRKSEPLWMPEAKMMSTTPRMTSCSETMEESGVRGCRAGRHG